MELKEKTPKQAGKKAAEWLDTVEDATEYAADQYPDSTDDQRDFVEAYRKART
jgi:hypothetical protein